MHRAEVEGLLFDKDGTLFDFHQSWSAWVGGLIDRLAIEAAARPHDIAERLEYDYANQVFCPGALSIAGTVAQQAEALAPALPRWSRERIEAYLVQAAAGARMVPAVPLAPLMRDFRAAGLYLGVATNDAEAAARAHLVAADILDEFHYIAGYDSGFGAKPGPGMCTAFAMALNLDPQTCVMIGDSRHDLAAGRAAGMLTVAVLTGPARAEELAPLADAVLPDIGALPAWLAERA